MPTVNSLIQRLLPRGSNPDRRDEWAELPLWPPDVFAVCATLVDRSGCYASPRYANGYPDGSDGCFFSRKGYYDEVKNLAQAWRANQLDTLQKYWSELMASRHCEVADHDHPTAKVWQDIAVELMMVADEVCIGMGFVPPPDLDKEEKKQRMFAVYYLEQHYRMLDGQELDLKYLPHSLCRMVPPGEVCVQPKTTTAQAGCTLRSLSHNLSLLPNWGEVKSTWRFAGPSDKKIMNLLAIPFPYRINASSLVPAGPCTGSEKARWFDEKGNRSNFFDVRQDWLNDGGKPIQAGEIATFLIDLINQARREVKEVHAVVLPELALDRPCAEEVARTLAEQPSTSLELFVTGMAYQDSVSQLPRNSVFACTIARGDYLEWVQNKHHRWKLERDQIRRYHLGSNLHPDYNWWERIDLSCRECEFRVFRRGSSLAALVCEDLARIDPVQTVIRSVGPNLVIALLMDGPQFERRWSGRYATVLADDPGSAVLTLTSLALVRRSNDPGQGEPRQIALWKQAGGRTEELSLPRGAHALLLNLWPDDLTSFTLDGRSDRGHTTSLFLSGIQTVTLANPPAWAVVD